MKLAGHSVLVTGGATGIGKAIALELARRGNRVTVCGRRQSLLDALVAEAPAITTVAADITDSADQERVFAIAGNAGPVTFLVNNAAMFNSIHDMDRDFTPELIEREVQTNVIAPMVMTQRFLSQLPAAQSGAILNIGSLSAWLEIGSQCVYAATKAALHSFSQSLRHLIADRDVVVFEVMTPAVDTGMVTHVDVPKMEANEFARRLLVQVERGRREIKIGADARLAYWGHRIAPGLVRALVRRKLRYRALPGTR